MTANTNHRPITATRRQFAAGSLAAAGALLVPAWITATGQHNSAGSRANTPLAKGTGGGWKSAPTGNTFGMPGTGTLPG